METEQEKVINGNRLISYHIVFDSAIRGITRKYWDKHNMADSEWFDTLSYVPFEVGDTITVPICHDHEILNKCRIIDVEKTVLPMWGCGQRYAGECNLVIYLTVESLDIEKLKKKISELKILKQSN